MLFDAPLKAWLNEFLDIVFKGKAAKSVATSKAALPA